MNSNNKAMRYGIAFSILLIFVAPGLVWHRPVLMGTWLSDFIVVIGLAQFSWLVLSGDVEKKFIPYFSLGLALMAIVILARGGERQAVINAVLALLVMAVFSISVAALSKKMGMPAVARIAAWFLSVAYVLQLFIAWTQYLWPQASFAGVVIVGEGLVFGNFAQANLFSEFQFWGALALIYLFSIRRLPLALLVVLLALGTYTVLAASGRLPFVYIVLIGLMVLLSGIARQDEIGKRMAQGVMLWLLLFALEANLFELLAGFLGGGASSGAERMMAGGSGRWRLWDQAFTLILTDPWFGVGWGKFASTYMVVPSAVNYRHQELFTHSHNLFLQIWVETGISGVVVLSALVLMVVAVVLGKAKGAKTERFFLASILMMLLVHSMFEYPLWNLGFLAMAVFAVSVLSSSLGFELKFNARPWLIFMVLSSLAYVGIGLAVMSKIEESWMPAFSASIDQQRVEDLAVYRKLPFFSFEAGYTMMRYLQPSAENLLVGERFLQNLAAVKPYPAVLANMVLFQRTAGKCQLAAVNENLLKENFPSNSLVAAVARLPVCQS